MVGLPKPLRNIARKLDIRVHPDPELAKKFDDDCGRRYINVSLNMISFFDGVADKVNDPKLKEYAKKIANASYHRDADGFKTYTTLYKNKLGEMGLWKSTKGISAYEKMKIMNRLRKLGKKAKEDKKKEQEEKCDKTDEKLHVDRGGY